MTMRCRCMYHVFPNGVFLSSVHDSGIDEHVYSNGSSDLYITVLCYMVHINECVGHRCGNNMFNHKVLLYIS